MKSSASSRSIQPSVEERVNSALEFLLHQNPLSKLSVSAVCRAAGVNRASLYTYHRDIVEKILGHSPQQKIEASKEEGWQARNRELSRRLRESEERYKAILLLCVEQQAEIQALKQVSSPNGRKGKPVTQSKG